MSNEALNTVRTDVRQKKSVSIVMMTTFSGNSFKGKQLPGIVNELESRGMFADGFGLYSPTDTKVYNESTRRKIHISGLARFLLSLNGKICGILRHPNRYIINEKIFSLIALLFAHPQGDIVLLKFRPNWAISFYQRKGKKVILELSENHPRYTYDAYRKECELCSVELPKGTYTNLKQIQDVEKSLLLADGFICLSDFSAKTFIDAGVPREKIKICPLKTGVNRLHRNVDLDSKTTFFCTANHSILKGTQHLIDLWNKRQYENDLVIIGNIYPEFTPIKNRAKHNKHIIFTGSMAYEKIVDLYSNCRGVGILISISESWGRSAFEYLGASMPVIVSPTCISGIVSDGVNGFIVKTEDASRLEKTIDRYINMSASEFETMRVAAFDSTKIDNYSFEKQYVDALEYFSRGTKK